MRNKEKDAIQIAMKRKAYKERAYELFCEKNIDAVSLQDIADATEYGIATLYRYFVNKPTLVVETAAWKWDQLAQEIWDRWEGAGYDDEKNAAVHFELYLDFFLTLYRDHRDFLSFNQCFNVYVRAEKIDIETLGPYQEMIVKMREHFHNTVYLKALQDHTIRTDEPEEKMFSKTLHLMLAAVTRYAVGLVYKPENGFDAMEELEFLKNMILNEYRV